MWLAISLKNPSPGTGNGIRHRRSTRRRSGRRVPSLPAAGRPRHVPSGRVAGPHVRAAPGPRQKGPPVHTGAVQRTGMRVLGGEFLA